MDDTVQLSTIQSNVTFLLLRCHKSKPTNQCLLSNTPDKMKPDNIPLCVVDQQKIKQNYFNKLTKYCNQEIRDNLTTT